MRLTVQWLLIGSGAALILYTFLLMARVNFHLGVILPALLGLALLAAGLLLPHLLDGHGVWTWLRVGALAAVIILSASLLLSGLLIHRQLRQPPDPGTDAIVILGAGLRGDRVSATLAARLRTALNWQKDHPALPLIVSGGQGPDEWISEAEAMSRWLIDHGVSPDDIILENQSVNTRENLQFATERLAEARPELSTASEAPRLLIVTSDYHVYRAARIAEKLGFEVSTLGSPTLAWLLPADFLRETVAIIHFHLLGGT
ncbi:MAG: YdcF family protein [Eubacteriales bacterium]|nr:YdcF family protein [Eubacteriales bacterium]